MDLVSRFMSVESGRDTGMRESSKTTKKVVKEFTIGPMGAGLREIGRKTSNMERESSIGQTVIGMREIARMT